MTLKLLIGAIVLYLLFKLFRKGLNKVGGSAGSAEIREAAGEDLVEDPVCHAYVPIGDACRMKVDGKTVYFCSPKCQDQYKSEIKRSNNIDTL